MGAGLQDVSEKLFDVKKINKAIKQMINVCVKNGLNLLETKYAAQAVDNAASQTLALKLVKKDGEREVDNPETPEVAALAE